MITIILFTNVSGGEITGQKVLPATREQLLYLTVMHLGLSFVFCSSFYLYVCVCVCVCVQSWQGINGDIFVCTTWGELPVADREFSTGEAFCSDDNSEFNYSFSHIFLS